MAQSLESRVAKAAISPYKWAYADALEYCQDKLISLGLDFENAKYLTKKIAEQFPYKGAS